jgi:hypothetical protein
LGALQVGRGSPNRFCNLSISYQKAKDRRPVGFFLYVLWPVTLTCAQRGALCRVENNNFNNGDILMGKRDDLIAKYADDLKNKCGMTPDMDLLTKVTIGCGPAIYNADASTVAGSQPAELETVKNNFLMKKLGLKDSADLDAAIASVLNTYGQSERNKYRAVVYYMLTKHFGKESVYG